MIPDTSTMTVPLRTDEHGAIRIGKTRVLLELVIHAYYMGETPEGIVDSYPSLTIIDVYAVIGYYLANREEIDAYVRQPDRQAEQILRDCEICDATGATTLCNLEQRIGSSSLN